MTTTDSDKSKLRRLEPGTLRQRLDLLPPHDGLIELWQDPAGLLAALVARELLPSAARYLAFALPEREAVWWACRCAAHTASQPSAAERKAIAAAEAWVRRPDEASQRDAAWAAAEAGYGVAGAWPALAAYWSRPVLPLDTRGGRGVETAIERASVRERPERQSGRLFRFILSGRDIAAGGAGRLPPEVGS